MCARAQASSVQIRRMEEQLRHQDNWLQEAVVRLTRTHDELRRARLTNEELRMQNQALESKVELQRAGSCQNVCCKALDFSRIPLHDVPSMMCEARGLEPIDVLIEQMSLPN